MTQINLKEVHDLKVVGALWCQIEVYLYLFDLEIYLIEKGKKYLPLRDYGSVYPMSKLSKE